MRSRREFLKSAAVLGAFSAPAMNGVEYSSPKSANKLCGDRPYWVGVVKRISEPVLTNLARRELRKSMPVETSGSAEKLRNYTHLEAISRLLVGLAPWLELHQVTGDEAALQQRYRMLARECLDAATDPKSPDFMNFSSGQQPLVDTAFLAQAILRAPSVLWTDLGTRVQRQLVDALAASRTIPPINNNHILFSAVIEAALLKMGEKTVEERLEGYLRKMLGWYRGDGCYADGEYFRFDYYNSFVIHPILVDVLALLAVRDERFSPAYKVILRRAQRYAEIQERLIAPDASYPSVGRSITYRFGAFQALGQMALLHQLPERVEPAQVRCALTAVIRRMIEAPGTFDKKGWLQVGFCGHQVPLGEHYISTGSLYLCSVGLLPLGLPASDRFWSDRSAPWTSQRLWAGEPLMLDRALRDETANVEIPSLKR